MSFSDISSYRKDPSGCRDLVIADQHTIFADIMNRPASWLQAEVSQTLRHLLALYSLLNADAPISRLPPEVLSLVFLWTASLSSPKTSWIRITHVCRQWRDVALQCPTLWTNITPQHPDTFVSMCLQRSAAASLQLDYNHKSCRDCRHSLDFAHQIRTHAARFSDIDITSPPAVMRNLVAKVVGKDVEDQLDDYWCVDKEGEVRGGFKPIGRKFDKFS